MTTTERLKDAPYLMRCILLQLVFLALVILGGLSLGQASTVDQLDSKVSDLTSKTADLSTDVPAAFARLKAKSDLIQNQLDHGTVLIGDYVAGHPGDTVILPLLFVPSSFSATGIQADIVVPSKLTVSATIAGQATTDAQKIVSTNTVNGVERFLIFGLNQNVIGQGEVILLTITIPSSATAGQYPIILDNPVASDANGDPILMSVMSGILEVL